MEQFMTSEEIAELLHVDPVTIRRLVNKGQISAYRIGADYRFAPSDLHDYLRRQRITANAQSDTTTGSSNAFDQFTQLLRKVIQGKHTTPTELLDQLPRRFTKRAQRVMMLAQEEAASLQHNYIGTEHLLLGLAREGEGIAAQVLTHLNIEVEQVRQAVEAIIGPGTHVVAGEVVLTPRAKKVIELAVDEARRLNHHFIGTEHLLLGLIREGDGIAAGVLESFGLRLEQVRAETLRILRTHQQEQDKASAATTPAIPPQATALLVEGETGILCAACGARCPDYFRHCFNCGQSLSQEEATNGEEA